MSSRLPTSSLFNLPAKSFPSPYNVGTDICHVPRILRLLSLRRGGHGGARKTWGGGSRDGVNDVGDEGSVKGEDAKTAGWRFIKKILREEEVAQGRERWEGALEGLERVRLDWDVCVAVRRRLKGVKGGKELGRRGVSAVKGGSWENLMVELGKRSEGEAEGERYVEVLRVMEEVMKWKGKYRVQAWRTPWSVVAEGIKEERCVERVVGDTIEELDGRRKELRGERNGEGDQKTMFSDNQIEMAQATVNEGLSSRDEAQALEVQREEEVFEHDEEVDITDAVAGESILKPSTENLSKVLKRNKATDNPVFTRGLQDDINAFLAIEEQLQRRLDQAEQALLAPARFLAGRFAAKEAIIKAHHHRRITYHDIAILKQAPNEFGSKPPRALVIDEDGKGTTEVKVSISHDGEYATAVALAVFGGEGAAGVVRSVKGRRGVGESESESDGGEWEGEGQRRGKKVGQDEEIPKFLW